MRLSDLSFIQEVARSIRVNSTNKIKQFLSIGQHRTGALSENLSELSRGRQRSFFESVPSDADPIVMKSVIYDWNDRSGVQIPRNCHWVLRPRARLIMIDRTYRRRSKPRWTNWRPY